jgi:hypothetical protein
MEMNVEAFVSIHSLKRGRPTFDKHTGTNTSNKCGSTTAVSTGTAPESMDEEYPSYSESCSRHTDLPYARTSVVVMEGEAVESTALSCALS